MLLTIQKIGPPYCGTPGGGRGGGGVTEIKFNFLKYLFPMAASNPVWWLSRGLCPGTQAGHQKGSGIQATLSGTQTH